MTEKETNTSSNGDGESYESTVGQPVTQPQPVSITFASPDDGGECPKCGQSFDFSVEEPDSQGEWYARYRHGDEWCYNLLEDDDE